MHYKWKREHCSLNSHIDSNAVPGDLFVHTITFRPINKQTNHCLRWAAENQPKNEQQTKITVNCIIQTMAYQFSFGRVFSLLLLLLRFNFSFLLIRSFVLHSASIGRYTHAVLTLASDFIYFHSYESPTPSHSKQHIHRAFVYIVFDFFCFSVFLNLKLHLSESFEALNRHLAVGWVCRVPFECTRTHELTLSWAEHKWMRKPYEKCSAEIQQTKQKIYLQNKNKYA